VGSVKFTHTPNAFSAKKRTLRLLKITCVFPVQNLPIWPPLAPACNLNCAYARQILPLLDAVARETIFFGWIWSDFLLTALSASAAFNYEL
jgi:hypothetical protein